MLGRLFAIALLLTMPLAAAAPPASPLDLPTNLDRWVYAELAFAQPSLTTISVSGDLYVYRYDVEGQRYDADEMGDAYNGLNRFGGATGNAFVTDVEDEVLAALRNILTRSFGNSAIIDGVTATVDRSTLVSGSGNPYDPPVRVSVGASVARTKEAVGLGTLSDAAVAAAFASGAKVGVDFTLTADPGYRILYTIGAPASPAGLAFEAGNDVAPGGASLRVDLDNSAGNSDSRAVAGRLVQSGVSAPTAEDIRSTIDVTMGDPVAGAAGLPMRVVVDSQVRALDVAARFPGALPSKVQLSFVNADGVRALRSTGVITDERLASANRALLDEVRADVQRAFGGEPTVTGGLSAADMAAQNVPTPYTDADPLKFNAFSNSSYSIEGADADDVDLAMRIGATANVGLDLFAANGRETSFRIHPPTIARFTQAEGGSVAVDGRTASFVVPAGERRDVTVAMRGVDAPEFTAEESDIAITVDLKDLDVSTGGALGGDLGKLVVDVIVTGELHVIKVPDDLKGALPGKLELEYLSSDAVRLLIEEGYVKPENLTKLERTLTETVAEKLGRALGGDIPVTGAFDSATLAVELVSTPVSAEDPITFRATAKFLKPMSGGAIEPQAAIALYTTELPLTLPKIEGRDTLYTIIAPKGLALTGSSAGEISKSPDGRDQLTVSPQGDSQAITMSLAVTPGFVMVKFWPLVLLAVVLLVLIIGTPVALVMRSRGKKKKAAAAPKK